MKKKIMGAMESFAKAMVQPLMFLSAAGILIVVGVLLTNSTITRIQFDKCTERLFGIIPQKSEKITIASSKLPSFKAGKALKDAVSK